MSSNSLKAAFYYIIGGIFKYVQKIPNDTFKKEGISMMEKANKLLKN